MTSRKWNFSVTEEGTAARANTGDPRIWNVKDGKGMLNFYRRFLPRAACATQRLPAWYHQEEDVDTMDHTDSAFGDIEEESGSSGLAGRHI